jgi:hypothetical protein
LLKPLDQVWIYLIIVLQNIATHLCHNHNSIDICFEDNIAAWRYWKRSSHLVYCSEIYYNEIQIKNNLRCEVNQNDQRILCSRKIIHTLFCKNFRKYILIEIKILFVQMMSTFSPCLCVQWNILLPFSGPAKKTSIISIFILAWLALGLWCWKPYVPPSCR